MSKINKKSGIPVFGQLLSSIPRQDFNKSVQKHQTDRYIKRFTSWDHVVTMLFGVIHKVGDLRELSSGIAAHDQSLRHLGMTTLPTKSTLSDRNKSRTPKIDEISFNPMPVTYHTCQKFISSLWDDYVARAYLLPIYHASGIINSEL